MMVIGASKASDLQITRVSVSPKKSNINMYTFSHQNLRKLKHLSVILTSGTLLLKRSFKNLIVLVSSSHIMPKCLQSNKISSTLPHNNSFLAHSIGKPKFLLLYATDIDSSAFLQ